MREEAAGYELGLGSRCPAQGARTPGCPPPQKHVCLSGVRSGRVPAPLSLPNPAPISLASPPRTSRASRAEQAEVKGLFV